MSSIENRVIVIGGGPVGLAAAQSLTKAGIDFVLLEQRPAAVIDAGSNLVLNPEGLRTLAKFGLLDKIEAVSTPLAEVGRINHAGQDLGNMNIFIRIKEVTGHALRVISRHDLTAVLYNNLPASAKAKIIPNKRLAAINKTSTGVTVTCTDNSTYSGSFVIGADGAHSKTRAQMRSLALYSSSNSMNPEVPFLTTYNCLWIRMPISAAPYIKPGMVSESHGSGCATQFFSGEDTAVIGVYESLPQPTKERQHYTQADEQALVDRWSSMRILKDHDLTLGEMYAKRLNAGLVSLEEGVLDHWSLDDKIVLVGDAAHKYTPSSGMGCNNGMIDSDTLVKQLVESEDRETAFRKYQDLRQQISIDTCKRSGQLTAMATWRSVVLKFVDTQVMSRTFVQNFISRSIKA